jgi:membrane protein implicated in regulation of membrane protease activity
MAFIDRRQRGPGRFLEWKLRLLAVGAVLLLVGMARNLDLLVILSIVVLAAAFLLRFFEKEDSEVDADEEDGEDDLDTASGVADADERQ